MSDFGLRVLERDPDSGPFANIARLWRAGELWPSGNLARERIEGLPCKCGSGRGSSHCGCDLIHWAPYDPTGTDLLRIMAFLGVEEARALDVISLHDSGWGHTDNIPIMEWGRTLCRLVSKLPPRRQVLNEVRRDTRAVDWVISAATVAVAKECLIVFDRGCDGCRYSGTGPDDHDMDCPWHVVVAGDSWVNDPSDHNARFWANMFSIIDSGVPQWVPTPYWNGTSWRGSAESLHFAAKDVLGDSRVREVVSAEVLRRIYD